MRDSQCAVDVLGKHSCTQSVMCVVRLADDIILRREWDYNTDGSKDLFAHDLHVRTSVCEDSGLDEVSRGAKAGTAKVERSAVLLSRVNVSHDALRQ